MPSEIWTVCRRPNEPALAFCNVYQTPMYSVVTCVLYISSTYLAEAVLVLGPLPRLSGETMGT